MLIALGLDDVAYCLVVDEDVFLLEVLNMVLGLCDDVDDVGDPVVALAGNGLDGDEALGAVGGDFEESVDGHVHDAGEGLVHELEELPADGHEEAEVLVHELGELADQVPRLSTVHDVGGDGGLGLLALLFLHEVEQVLQTADEEGLLL